MKAMISAVGAVALSVAMGQVHADTFDTAKKTTQPGERVALFGKARPNSFMSAYFSCDNGCGQTHVGVATVDAQGQYLLKFNIPANAKPGGAFVDIGCDKCGNGWRRVGGLQIRK